MKHYKLIALVLALLLLAALAAGCGGPGGGDNSVNTPVPPAQRTGMDALNAEKANGLKANCENYPAWMVCE